MLDLTEEDEIIELIEELKTKQVKYPRKGKGVRRKRSNTSKLVFACRLFQIAHNRRPFVRKLMVAFTGNVEFCLKRFRQ